MKKFLLLSMILISTGAAAQSNPPPYGAFEYSAGAWIAAVSTSVTNPLSYTPPPAALYCQNSSGQWVPADSSCFGGGSGSGTVGYFPIWTASTILGDSVLDYGVTHADILTSSKPAAVATNTGAVEPTALKVGLGWTPTTNVGNQGAEGIVVDLEANLDSQAITSTTVYGADIEVFNNGGTIGSHNLGAVFAFVGNEGAAPVTHLRGIESQVDNDGSGHVTEADGIFVDPVANVGGGTIDIVTGLRIADQSGVGTQTYAIYQEGATDKNYFHGSMQTDGITGHGTKGPVCVDASGNLYVGNNSGVGAPCP